MDLLSYLLRFLHLQYAAVREEIDPAYTALMHHQPLASRYSVSCI